MAQASRRVHTSFAYVFEYVFKGRHLLRDTKQCNNARTIQAPAT